MPTPPLSDEVLKHTVALYLTNRRSQMKTCVALNIAAATLGYRLKEAARRGILAAPPLPEGAEPPPGFVVSRHSATYDGAGNLKSHSVQTKPEPGDTYAVPAGHTVKGESALLDPDGRVLARWVKTREDGSGNIIEALRAAFDTYDGAAPAIAAPRHAEDDLLTVYPVPDLHLGMYAWHHEAGEDYDVDIAVKTATDAVAALVAQSRPSRRAVVLGLGDYFHANDAKAVTPASGHRLDVDGRWPKVMAAGAKLATALVELVAKRHADVEVVFLPGNHDPDAAVSLTVALALFYSKHTRIRVHQEPGIAWYRRHGRVLLGATHGHTMKPDRMAMMLAADRPEDWGATAFRHFLFGHVHHESAREVGPVRVESFGTPAAKDAYAAGAGYRSSRSMTALTFHAQQGEIGRHRVNITAPRPRVRVKAR
jgi:hypothetical protein